jgi:hypothetical protein
MSVYTGKIGEYVHYRYDNYQKYGIFPPDPGNENSKN